MAEEQYRIFTHVADIDISETDIYDYDPEVLNQLLIDHTMSAKLRREKKDPSLRANIFWATNDYENREPNDGYHYRDEILPEKIIKQNGRVVMPRVNKDADLQVARSKDKAEVFTPSWICNKQNNLIDEAWFGRKDVFNVEITTEDGQHTWQPTEGEIVFPDDSRRTWKHYVCDNRMEITCGEAPYLVSRYDVTTSELIPLHRRIGLLDRKLRVVSEHCHTSTEWIKMAKKAYQHTYGYEWQGDNLLLAREALLYTYIEYFQAKFPGEHPGRSTIRSIARIISWNLWQMDGLRYVVPGTCDEQYELGGLFGDQLVHQECPSCKKGIPFVGHIGDHCLIRDWAKKKPADYKPQEGEDPKSQPWQKIEYRQMIHDKSDNQEEF